MQFLVDQAAVRCLKDNMGYVSAVGRCETCKQFVNECSGENTAAQVLCTLNPAACFPVERDSRCEFYEPLPPRKEVVKTKGEEVT